MDDPQRRCGSRTAATPNMERFVISPAVNYDHQAFHLGCCRIPRSASAKGFIKVLSLKVKLQQAIRMRIKFLTITRHEGKRK